MLFKGPIEKRVLAVIRDRISEAETDFIDKCEEIERQCEAKIEEAESQRDLNKEIVLDQLVTRVFARS